MEQGVPGSQRLWEVVFVQEGRRMIQSQPELDELSYDQTLLPGILAEMLKTEKNGKRDEANALLQILEETRQYRVTSPEPKACPKGAYYAGNGLPRERRGATTPNLPREEQWAGSGHE
jgi:hypothetical protein